MTVSQFGRPGTPTIVCLTGVSAPEDRVRLDLDALGREWVLDNDVVFGSVNANRRHYEVAADVLARADRSWLGAILTRRVPVEGTSTRWTGMTGT